MNAPLPDDDTKEERLVSSAGKENSVNSAGKGNLVGSARGIQ